MSTVNGSPAALAGLGPGKHISQYVGMGNWCVRIGLMRRLRPTPRIARPTSAYAVSRCAKLPVTSRRLYEADTRGEFGSVAFLN